MTRKPKSLADAMTKKAAAAAPEPAAAASSDTRTLTLRLPPVGTRSAS